MTTYTFSGSSQRTAVKVRRTPRDDAPPYDPTLWEGQDVFYLTQRAALQREKKSLDAGKSTLEYLSGEAAKKERSRIDEGIAAHTLPARPTQRWWERLLSRWLPPPPTVKPLDLRELSLDELMFRFQAALQNGDVKLSSVFAQELARRKAQLPSTKHSTTTTDQNILHEDAAANSAAVFGVPRQQRRNRPHGMSRDAPAGLFALPFAAYAPQRELLDTVGAALVDGKRRANNGSSASASSSDKSPFAASRVVGVELPTGCGKTAALLSAALSFQAQLSRQCPTPHDVLDFFSERCQCGDCVRHKKLSSAAKARGGKKPRPLAEATTTNTAGTDSENDDTRRALDADPYAVSEDSIVALLKSMYRGGGGAPSLPRRAPSQKSANVRSPPCTIFYCTRTHTQLAQCVRELRRFSDSATPQLKHNILASRAHYCINRKVRKMVDDKTVAVERNNLGELCDKLVELRQCSAVDSFVQLAHRSLFTPLRCSGRGPPSYAWDMEDLVHEGVAMNACPYYAARDLVQYAGINFATYSYVLDPVIRRECKFEGAVKNHSIVILDEGHNACEVGQEALSCSLTLADLAALREEIGKLTTHDPTSANAPLHHDAHEQQPGGGFDFVPTYGREFRLTKWSLRELFTFLDRDVLAPIMEWTVVEAPDVGAPSAAAVVEATQHDVSCGQRASRADEAAVRSTPWHLFEAILPGSKTSGTHWFLRVPPLPDASRAEWHLKFQQVYMVVSSLGVTFNPFEISVWGLGVIKRLLCALRFALTEQKSFACWVDVPSCGVGAAGGATCNRQLHIRCLDGSIAFQHLARSAYCVVLASGTLGPMPQLFADLKLSKSTTTTLETDHVIDVAALFRIGVVTRLTEATGSTESVERPSSSVPLRCTFSFFKDPAMLEALACNIIELVNSALPAGAGDQRAGCGALVFLPNSSVADAVFRLASKLVATSTTAQALLLHDETATVLKKKYKHLSVLVEPKRAEHMEGCLDAHRRAIQAGHRSVLLGVYRGKLSEGVDFVDDMARLVVCVGLPLRPVTSRAVEAQRWFGGDAWYTTDAVRAVNQAIGRCIRHSRDFGAVVLMDERYSTSADVAQQLPKWCRGDVLLWRDADAAAAALRSFYAPLMSRRAEAMRRAGEPSGKADAADGISAENGGASALTASSIFFGNISGSAAQVGALARHPRSSAEGSELEPMPLDTRCGKRQRGQEITDTERTYWRSTALKLLHEATVDASEVRRCDVDRVVQELVATASLSDKENTEKVLEGNAGDA